MRLNYLLLITFIFSISINLNAQYKGPYHMLRYDDNFSYLKTDSLKNDFFDPIKYISLSKSNPNAYLSMGGELRHNYKLYKNEEWNGTADENGHFQQRYMFHTDWHLGSHLRVFSQVNSGLTNGRDPAPRAIIDENKFEVNQLFLEYLLGEKNDLQFGIRVGRMEEKYGTARLIATREGQNVRRSFDGIHAFLKGDHWKMDMFALKQIISQPGVFDDFRDPFESIFGAVFHNKAESGITYEPYVFANQDFTGQLFGQKGEEWHITPGFRFYKRQKNVSWNLETALQFGGFENEKIFGYLFAGNIGYKFSDKKYKPFVGFKFQYSTGDKDTNPGGIGTFEPFFPKAVLGQAAVLNPANLIQFHGEVSFNPFKNSKITISHDQLLRASTSDVFYDPCGDPIVEFTDHLSEARYIGHQSRIALLQNFGPHYYILLEYTIFPPGTFLKEMGRNDILQYTSVRSVFRF